MNYQPHEYADLFPLMSGQEFVDLKADIKQRGLLQPVVMFEGRILDGRNRFKACQEVGAEIKTVEYTGSDPLGDVISWNLKRRHLNEGQRASVAAKIANMKLGDNQYTGSANLPTHHSNGSLYVDQPRIWADNQNKVSNQQAAEMLNVSERSVRTAKKVQEDAIPEISEKMAAGEISVSAASIASSLPIDDQLEIIEEINQGVKPVEAIKRHVHVSQNSGENEWYTPKKYIDAARKVLGNIDLDPASCDLANETVGADEFYSKEDSGLDRDWHGNVWLNPPYAQPLISQFAEKVVDEMDNFNQAVILVNNATETKWFSKMAKNADAICFPESRIKFIDKDGNPSGAPLQGQAFIYFGCNKENFAVEFSQFGFVVSSIE